MLGTAYLVLYNIALFCGWTLILWKVLFSPSTPSPLYASYVSLCQITALLEILHAYLKLVKSNVRITTLQIFSRIFIWFFTVIAHPTWPNEFVVKLLLSAWSLSEVVRYSFYASNLLSSPFHALLWARYSFFIVLYPLGVLAELMLLFGSTGFVDKWGVAMPNPANIAFSLKYGLFGIMLLYARYFPLLYGHMLSQRRKILS